MVRAGVQQDKKSIIQPGTIWMETGFGNPGVQQSSPGVPPSLQALDALDAHGTFSAEGKSRVKHYIFVSGDE